ncbi:MAG: stage II sporulation protein M [Nanoarchaeota archaeon]|nr:stage II sporulation protein M [Nanoarchaeota archaeon]MBU4452494.1 stage II sporulation protein M [Nanoarchaeota archaeon]MCG2723429.1 stage II sporulation protein M [archaeon]
MVLENIETSDDAEKKPWHVFIYGVMATTVSLFLAAYIFPSQISTTFLFLVTLASFPMIYNVLNNEETLDEDYEHLDLGFLKIHKKAFDIYTFLFLGIIVAASFWYTVLPADFVKDAFSEQIKTLSSIRGENIKTGFATFEGKGFMQIFLNNFSVAFVSFILSFFYGAGAIFILAWNASIIAVFVGGMARAAASEISHPLSAVYGYLISLPAGLISIALHGVPEIAAYFVAGIAGGILSIGIIKRHQDTRIIKDAAALFGLSVALLIIAAFIEVWITPAL